jgi:transglutaminase-like putative cysteine protease
MIAAQGYARGDCDDVAILGAALGKAAGFPARFVLLGFGGPMAPYQHVFTEIGTRQGWMNLDVTRPRHPPIPTKIKRMAI